MDGTITYYNYDYYTIFITFVVLPPTFLAIVGLNNPDSYTYTIEKADNNTFVNNGEPPEEQNFTYNVVTDSDLTSSEKELIDDIIGSEGNSDTVSSSMHFSSSFDNLSVHYLYYEEEWYTVVIQPSEDNCSNASSCIVNGFNVIFR